MLEPFSFAGPRRGMDVAVPLLEARIKDDVYEVAVWQRALQRHGTGRRLSASGAAIALSGIDRCVDSAGYPDLSLPPSILAGFSLLGMCGVLDSYAHWLSLREVHPIAETMLARLAPPLRAARPGLLLRWDRIQSDVRGEVTGQDRGGADVTLTQFLELEVGRATRALPPGEVVRHRLAEMQLSGFLTSGPVLVAVSPPAIRVVARKPVQDWSGWPTTGPLRRNAAPGGPEKGRPRA